jgi:hypothetical protein
MLSRPRPPNRTGKARSLNGTATRLAGKEENENPPNTKIKRGVVKIPAHALTDTWPQIHAEGPLSRKSVRSGEAK